MLGKEAIAAFLEHKGLENIFYLPGIHTLSLGEVLNCSRFRVIMGRHEADIAYMADGFSRATGTLGFLLVGPGPAVGSVVAPCMEAWWSNVPLMIMFIGPTAREVTKGALHAVESPESLFTRITKRTYVITSPDDILPVLNEAFDRAVAPRQGPVAVSVAYNVLERPVRTGTDPHFGNRPGAPRATLDGPGLEEAIRGSQKPVIIGGRGLMSPEARIALERICSGSGIPLLVTTSGKGILREDEPYVFGNVIAKGIARDILRTADTIIAMGTRLRAVDTKSRGIKLRRLVHVDVDDRWFGRNYTTVFETAGDMMQAVGIVGDCFARRRTAWDMEELRKAYRDELAGLVRDREGSRTVALLRRLLPPDTVTVWDVNIISLWAEYCFPVFDQRSFLAPGGVSPIFYAFPAAIGAKLGRPHNPCLCVTGDGGFLGAAGELATMARYKIPVVVMVCNNNSFGLLETSVSERHGVQGRMALTNPDFVALAESFGIKAVRARGLPGLERALSGPVTWDEPFLIEFRQPVISPPWASKKGMEG